MFQYDQPDARGHFGIYGGSFVAETLSHALDELRQAYDRYRDDAEFLAEFRAGGHQARPHLGGVATGEALYLPAVADVDDPADPRPDLGTVLVDFLTR